MRLGTGGSKLELGAIERVPEEELGSPQVGAVEERSPVE